MFDSRRTTERTTVSGRCDNSSFNFAEETHGRGEQEEKEEELSWWKKDRKKIDRWRSSRARLVGGHVRTRDHDQPLLSFVGLVLLQKKPRWLSLSLSTIIDGKNRRSHDVYNEAPRGNFVSALLFSILLFCFILIIILPFLSFYSFYIQHVKVKCYEVKGSATEAFYLLDTDSSTCSYVCFRAVLFSRRLFFWRMIYSDKEIFFVFYFYIKYLLLWSLINLFVHVENTILIPIQVHDFFISTYYLRFPSRRWFYSRVWMGGHLWYYIPISKINLSI